jgi:hypothetical protein
MKRVLLLVAGAIALCAQPGGFAQTPDPLAYARGFLVTGNYVVAGVDLPRAGGTATLNFSNAGGNAVPADAEIVAAFLYWETIQPQAGQGFPTAAFRGRPIDVAKASRLTSLPGTGASCWGSSGSATALLTVYRADVLHMLPKHYDAADKWTGRYLVNDADLLSHNLPHHSISLPQQGTGNRTTTSAGASLVVIYRHPEEPLRKVLLYDGPHAQTQGEITVQSLAGFYRSAVNPRAQLTTIIGSGADNRSERVVFNGQVLATNPVPAPIDSSSDRGWANPTFDVSAVMALNSTHQSFGETATLRIDHGATTQNSSPYECLTMAAVVFSTTVADVDADGLPDGLEDAALGLKDPPAPAFPLGQPLPNLHAMGARVGQRDLFIEINAMVAAPGTSYGSVEAPFNSQTSQVTDHEGHDHLPSPAVLKTVGDALAAGGIAVHFDVGDLAAYHSQFTCEDAQECDAAPYLVPSSHARGGERISERACADCQFKDYPGTVGWPYGFQLYRDAPVNADGAEIVGLEALKQAATEQGQLRRRFDRNRQDYFHYALYAHARGKAKPTNERVPSSVSGVADLPGRNLLITLGLWDTEHFVGSEFVQASTTLHETGHNLNLWHGGSPAHFGSKALSTVTFVEPNCKPNYLSSMSYQFQVHGLIDQSGTPRIDFSSIAHEGVGEGQLSDSPLFPTARYRAAWFVPANSPMAVEQDASVARRYCNGSPFDAGVPAPQMARVESEGVDTVIDWDGDPASVGGSGDVNFDGIIDDVLTGFDDWMHVRLDQKRGVRPARIFKGANGDLIDFGSGDLIDFGSGDLIDFGSGDLIDFGSGTHIVHLGTGDFFRYGSGDLIDFGSGDLIDFGSGDLIDFGSGALMVVGADGDLIDFGTGDLIDFGSGDLIDFGSGDLIDFGSGDLIDFGSGDLIDFGSGDLIDFGSGTGVQELDFEAAMALSRPRPHSLTACVLGADCAAPVVAPFDPLYHRMKLEWKAPTFGTVAQYEVYRRTATSPAVLIGTTATRQFVDSEELPNGVTFFYTVKARFADNSVSGNSNVASKTAINEPPVAVNDSYEMDQDTTLSVPTAGVLGNDVQDVDSAASARRVLGIVSQPLHGVLVANANGSFTYTPAPGFSGTDTFTYVADNGVWSGDATTALSAASNTATVTIVVRGVPYSFVNVQNLPPPKGRSFNTGSTIPVQWQWTNNAGTALDTGAWPVVVTAYACSTGNKLPAAYPTGSFTPEQPGSGNSFAYHAASRTWQFNWKLTYTVDGIVYNLPAGTYVLQIRKGANGRIDPATTHTCASGALIDGALLQVK